MTKSLSLSFDIYISHFSALLLSDHRADGRMVAVAFSWSDDVLVFLLRFQTGCLKIFTTLLTMIDGER